MTRPVRLALIAFTFHGFGVRWIARETLGPRLLRDNVVAVAGTIAAVAACLALLPPGSRSIWAWTSFLIGHFGWGTYLAWRMYQRAGSAD